MVILMMRLADVEKWLERAGFEWSRTHGSHRIWTHTRTGRIVILVYKRSFSRRDVEHLERLVAAASGEVNA